MSFHSQEYLEGAQIEISLRISEKEHWVGNPGTWGRGLHPLLTHCDRRPVPSPPFRGFGSLICLTGIFKGPPITELIEEQTTGERARRGRAFQHFVS